MKGSQPIVLTRDEVLALHGFMQFESSKVRTYKIQRDTAGVLGVLNPDGRFIRLTPKVSNVRV